jgi:isoquinoline 1-oxidoreductase subunit alpha
MSRTIALTVNDRRETFDGDPEMPLLWYLRDGLRLTGTKYGCGVGQCGACTVQVNGRAQRACNLPMSRLAGARVRTVESLESAGRLHAVQQAWIEEDVAQCGYCQSGQIMSVVALLERRPRPSEADIDAIGNLCRCGTHVRIRRAVQRAAELLREGRP